MRIHRFFVSELVGERKIIEIGDTSHLNQWRNVFRFRSGDRVILFDGSGFEYMCEFVSLSSSAAELSIVEKNVSNNLPKRNVILFFALIKKDKVEWVLEKGTELGVSMFIPIVSSRTEKKGLSVERAKKIIAEASEQSGRSTVPVLHEILPLRSVGSVLETLPTTRTVLVCDRSGKHLSSVSLGSDVCVFIGPEGGWSPEDLAFFTEQNFSICSLGTQTLRAETASIAALSLVLLG